MRSFIRRSTTLAVLGALAVGSGLPAVAQSEGGRQNVTHRQSVLTEVDPDGSFGTSRVFTQLTASGSGEVTVRLPNQSTQGLRSLDGFGGPDVDGDTVIHTLAAGADDGARARTVADSTADLPVSLSIVYRLDGQEIDPSELAGRDGRVEVEYTVRNLTSEPVDVVAFDAENNRVVETMDVPVPMVGTLSLTLPHTFTNVDAPGAVTVGDGRRNTVVSFNVILMPVLGDVETTVTWTAESVDTAIPSAELQVVPVDTSSFGSLNTAADSAKTFMDGLTTIANGALIINSNVSLLANGAADLLDGLEQLSDGASALNDGLANTAAPGAQQLSEGLSTARAGGGTLASGLGELALGATRLSGGLGDARAGGVELAGGLRQLADGGAALRAGSRDLSAGAGQLASGLGDLSSGVGRVAAGTPTLAGGAGQIRDGLVGLNAATEAFPEAIDGLNDIAGGLAGVDGGLDTLIGAVGSIRAGIANNPECNPLTNPDACSLLDGLQSVYGTFTDGNPLLPSLEGFVDGLSAATTQTTAGRNAAVAAIAEIDGAVAELEALAASLDPDERAEAEAIVADLRAAREQVEAARVAAVATLGNAGLAGPNTFAPLVVNGLERMIAGVTRVDPNPMGEDADPGLLQALGLVQGGLTNPACDTEDPQNPANPCGLKQVVGSLLLPGANLLVTRLGGGLSNPACDLENPQDPGNPCGLTQVIGQLLLPGAQDLAAGAAELNTGIQNDLLPGAQAAASGGRELAAGAGQLAAGANDLAAGAGAAATGSQTLVGGLGQLADGGRDLAAGAGTAASGAGDLASGLVQLDDGASQLAAGLGDAADGSGQIAEGLEAAADGGGQIAAGTVALGEGIEGQLIGGVSGGRLEAGQQLEYVRAVAARGREGAAPYGVAEGADASTVFQFDIAGVNADGGPSTPLLVVLALVALAAAGGLGLALQRRLSA